MPAPHSPLSIAYLIDDTSLSGGNRIALAQADALIDRGNRVTIITRGSPVDWRESRAEWHYVREFQDDDLSRYDFVIGTFWTTLAAAWRLAGERGLHLCQGYEGSFTAYQPLAGRIEEAYTLPLAKIVVSPHLVELCRRFHDDVEYIGQIVDQEFFQNVDEHEESRPLRVLLVGPAQADFKGIDVGYEAIREARRRGAEITLIRVSQWPPATGEPIELAAEFRVGLPSSAMAELVAGCDLFIGPSRWQEGFGLPAAEAMAAGLPAVLTEIPSFLSFDAEREHALFAPEGSAVELGAQLARLCEDRLLRRRLARRARQVAEQYRADRVGARLEAYFLARRERIEGATPFETSAPSIRDAIRRI